MYTIKMGVILFVLILMSIPPTLCMQPEKRSLCVLLTECCKTPMSGAEFNSIKNTPTPPHCSKCNAFPLRVILTDPADLNGVQTTQLFEDIIKNLESFFNYNDNENV